MVAESLLRVILQPGHGLGNHDVTAYDSGAVSCYGVEAEIAADVVDRVLLLDTPVGVLLTPVCSSACVPAHKKTFSKAKGRAVPVSHLSYTIDWINAHALRNAAGRASGDYALSIHMNEADNEEASGVLVVYDHRSDTREKEAKIIADVVAAKLGLKSRGAMPDTDTPRHYIAFVEETDPPALLIELGFITNAGDVAAVKECGAEATVAAIEKLKEMRP